MIDTSTGELICGGHAVYMQPLGKGQYRYVDIQCLRDFQHDGPHEDELHQWPAEGNVKLKQGPQLPEKSAT